MTVFLQSKGEVKTEGQGQCSVYGFSTVPGIEHTHIFSNELFMKVLVKTDQFLVVYLSCKF